MRDSALLRLPVQAKKALLQASNSRSVFHAARYAVELAISPVPLVVRIFPPGYGPGRHAVSDGWTWSLALATDREIDLIDKSLPWDGVPMLVDARLIEEFADSELLLLVCRKPWHMAESN